MNSPIAKPVPDPLTAKKQFLQGMRQVAGAVTIVTTIGPNGERRGVTATATCSLTADPPTVLACINRETWVGQFAPLSGQFCINVLSSDQQNVAEAFAGRAGLVAEDRFQVGDWVPDHEGAPQLGAALVRFECRLAKAVEYATHVILIGEVANTFSSAECGSPLLYHDGTFTTTKPKTAA